MTLRDGSRLLCLALGLLLMGYTLSISNYHAWQDIVLLAGLIGIIVTWVVFKLPSGYLRKMLHYWQQLAVYPFRSILLVGLVLLYVVLQNCWKGKIPEPTTYDELAYLLSAETFLQGQWTNQTPTGWEHFETIHVTLSPSYHGKYQPGMGMMLALGQWVFRHHYAGVVLALVLASLAMDWMFHLWLPARWALLASLLASIALTDTWNTYYLGGPLSAAAGALLLGTLRVVIDRGSCWYHGCLLGMSFTLFFWSRPFEGVVLSAMVCLYAIVTLWRNGRWMEIVRIILPGILLVIIPVGYVQLRYNEACVGSPWKLPYLEHEKQYALTPLFLWQSERSEKPRYRHRELQKFNENVLTWYDFQQTGNDWLAILVFKLGVVWLFFHHLLWLAFWPAMPDLLRHRWSRVALLFLCIYVSAILSVTWLFHHYVAPCMALITYLLVMGLRHLRCWKYAGKPWGRWLFLALLFSYLAVMGVKTRYVAREALFPAVMKRQELLAKLVNSGGQHLVLVEYSQDHNPGHEWVYNSYHIPGQTVIWARAMTKDKNKQLIATYPGRTVWKLFVDKHNETLTAFE